MARFSTSRFLSIVAVVMVALMVLPTYGFACESCRSVNPDSPLTAGMNAAIIMLLIVINFVLGSFVLFFLHLRKQARLYLSNMNNVETN